MAKPSSVADDKLEEPTEKYLLKHSQAATGNRTDCCSLLKQAHA